MKKYGVSQGLLSQVQYAAQQHTRFTKHYVQLQPLGAVCTVCGWIANADAPAPPVKEENQP